MEAVVKLRKRVAKEYPDEKLINLIIFWQKHPDFISVIESLLRNRLGEIIFKVVENNSFSRKLRKKAIMTTFEKSLMLDDFDVTLKLWYFYREVLTEFKIAPQMLSLVVKAFVRSPTMLEPKIFLIMEMKEFFNYELVD